MDITPTLGKFPRPKNQRAASLTLISDLLTAGIALDFVVVADLWRYSEVSHRLLPGRAVANPLSARTLVGEKVSIFVDQSVAKLLLTLDDRRA
jgi:hypothetical protein